MLCLWVALGEVAWMVWKCDSSLETKSDGSGRVVAGSVVKNSPGKQRVAPKTISADVAEKSYLRAARIPRRMSGRQSTPSFRVVSSFECGFKLPVKTFDHTVSLGVIGC